MTLEQFFQENPKVAIAFSGGVDSAYLLYAALRHGAQAKAYYVNTAFQPAFELEDAKNLARQLHAQMCVLDVDVLCNDTVTQNPKNRCYYCKKVIFSQILEAAKADGFTVLLDGTNASDDASDRPGMKALMEMSVRSPLRECDLRGGAGDEWIADIEAGIKKEVSVGCAMGESICSVCGQSYGSCGHMKGEIYDGQVCCAILRNPVDAYEFSFVAVPAQPNAGVLKGLGRRNVSLKELADEHGAQEEFRVLFKMAQLGKQYAKQLEDEVVRLCLSLDVGVEETVLRSAAGKMAPEELMKFKEALNERMAKSYPMQMQLSRFKPDHTVESDYLI